MQLEWELFEKLQMVSPSFCLKPIEYGVFREMVNDSSSNSEVEDDKEEDEEGEEDYDDADKDKEEEEDYYEMYMERELQDKFTESGQYEAKEGTSSMGKLGKNKGVGQSGWQY